MSRVSCRRLLRHKFYRGAHRGGSLRLISLLPEGGRLPIRSGPGPNAPPVSYAPETLGQFHVTGYAAVMERTLRTTHGQGSESVPAARVSEKRISESRNTANKQKHFDIYFFRCRKDSCYESWLDGDAEFRVIAYQKKKEHNFDVNELINPESKDIILLLDLKTIDYDCGDHDDGKKWMSKLGINSIRWNRNGANFDDRYYLNIQELDYALDDFIGYTSYKSSDSFP